MTDDWFPCWVLYVAGLVVGSLVGLGWAAASALVALVMFWLVLGE